MADMMMIKILGMVVVALLVQSTTATTYLKETFEDGLGDGWVKSEAKKDGVEEEIAQYNGVFTIKEELSEGENKEESYSNKAITAADANRHYALSAKLSETADFGGKPFVVQYEVQYQETVACGGSYMKLLSATDGLDLSQVTDKSPYTILFGPDKCGPDAHFRFIFRHKSPVTGEYREVHAHRVTNANSLLFSDHKTHLVTLVITPDNKFSMSVDKQQVLEGILGATDKFEPALSPPKMIDDPSDVKPEDWIDEKMMDDPEDVKPDDWDQPKMIVDPEATKPEDWDDEEDGEWEPPMIGNPEYKGEYKTKQIENPDYKGVWSPRQIENPEYFTEENPYKMTPIGAVSYELWTTTGGITFDNIIITDSVDEAEEFAKETYDVKRAREDAADAQSASMGSFISETLANLSESAEENPIKAALLALFGLSPVVALLTMSGGSAEGGEQGEQTGEGEKQDEEEEEEEKEETEEKVEEIDDEEDKGEEDNEEADSKEDGEVAGKKKSGLRNRKK